MSGLVNQVQADAIDPTVSLTILLRKVKLAAVKLGLEDTLEWVDSELEGYTKKVPEYREISGKLKWLNPYQGYLPVGFHDNDTAQHFQNWPIPEPITSLESTIKAGDGTFHLQMPPSVTNVLSRSVGFPVTSAILDVPKGSIVAIIEHVRGLVLNWALELERAGVTGEGMSFSDNERQKARSAHITIGHFQGSFNTGDLSGTNARIVSDSVDNSINVTGDDAVFGDVHAAIETGVEDGVTKELLLKRLGELQRSERGASRLAAYRQFVSDAADHMTILAPFIPALSAFLG